MVYNCIEVFLFARDGAGFGGGVWGGCDYGRFGLGFGEWLGYVYGSIIILVRRMTTITFFDLREHNPHLNHCHHFLPLPHQSQTRPLEA